MKSASVSFAKKTKLHKKIHSWRQYKSQSFPFNPNNENRLSRHCIFKSTKRGSNKRQGNFNATQIKTNVGNFNKNRTFYFGNCSTPRTFAKRLIRIWNRRKLIKKEKRCRHRRFFLNKINSRVIYQRFFRYSLIFCMSVCVCASLQCSRVFPCSLQKTRQTENSEKNGERERERRVVCACISKTKRIITM